MPFSLLDTDFHPMTSKLKIDLVMVKMYLFTKSEDPSSKMVWTLQHEETENTSTQTDLTEISVKPHVCLVIKEE